VNTAPTGERAGLTPTGLAAFEFTFFTDRYASNAQRIVSSWPRFVERVEKVGVQPTKDGSPPVSFCLFGDHRTPDGCIRSDANVVALAGVIVEHDQGTLSPTEALGRVERHHLRALIATTWSHTAEHPRWRGFFPLSQHAAPSEFFRFVAGVNGSLGGGIAPESFDLSRSYYIGRRETAEYLTMATFDDPTEGFSLDVWEELDQVAIYPETVGPATPLAPALEQRIPRGMRDRTLASLAGTLRRRGLEAEEILPTLAAVNARRCDPPLPQRDLVRIARSIARKPIGRPLLDKERAA
jgi:hypothetical protein